MRVTVYYFAVLRERSGQREQTLEVGSNLSVSALYRQLFSAQNEGILPVLFAVNQEYVDASHVLKDGDEVAFIPPLGGG